MKRAKKGFTKSSLSKSETTLSFIPTEAVHFGQLKYHVSMSAMRMNGLPPAKMLFFHSHPNMGRLSSILKSLILMMKRPPFAQTAEDIWLEAIRETMDGEGAVCMGATFGRYRSHP